MRSNLSDVDEHGRLNDAAMGVKTSNAVGVDVSGDTLRVELSDGRTMSVPVDWYPRLVHATEKERANWRIIGRGQGIHWEDVEEDISVQGLLAGNRSGESEASLMKWLKATSRRQPERLDPDGYAGPLPEGP